MRLGRKRLGPGQQGRRLVEWELVGEHFDAAGERRLDAPPSGCPQHVTGVEFAAFQLDQVAQGEQAGGDICCTSSDAGQHVGVARLKHSDRLAAEIDGPAPSDQVDHRDALAERTLDERAVEVDRHPVEEERHVLGEPGVVARAHLRQLAPGADADEGIDGVDESRRLDEHIDVTERPPRGVGVDGVGQRHALQQHRPDIRCLQQAVDVERRSLQAQHLLHLVAVGTSEDGQLIVGQLDRAVAPHLQQEPVEPLAAHLLVQLGDVRDWQRSVERRTAMRGDAAHRSLSDGRHRQVRATARLIARAA